MQRSKIWEIPEDEFKAIVAHSTSITDILRKLGVSWGGDTRQTLQKRIEMLHLDTSHLSAWKEFEPENKIPLEEILVENSTYKRTHLKKRLVENNLLEYRCAICGLEPQWEGKDLVLWLDHINGVKDDHRLENLRFLCPNCHSQTETFAGKNVRKTKNK